MKILNQLTKLSLIVLFVASALSLSACGGSDEFKPSSEAEKKAVTLIKEKFSDYKILSYELMAQNYNTNGKKLQQCLNNENQAILFATQSQSSNKNEIILTASAFVFTTETNDIKVTKPELIIKDYRECLK